MSTLPARLFHRAAPRASYFDNRARVKRQSPVSQSHSKRNSHQHIRHNVEQQRGPQLIRDPIAIAILLGEVISIWPIRPGVRGRRRHKNTILARERKLDCLQIGLYIRNASIGRVSSGAPLRRPPALAFAAEDAVRRVSYVPRARCDQRSTCR